jgi:hypothetical protein
MTDEEEDEEPAGPGPGGDIDELFPRWRALMENPDAAERDATPEKRVAYVADMGFGAAWEEIMRATADGELELDLAEELVGTLGAKLDGRR